MPDTAATAALTFTPSSRPNGCEAQVECPDGTSAAYLVLSTARPPTPEDVPDAEANHHRRYEGCAHGLPVVNPQVFIPDGPVRLTVTEIRPHRVWSLAVSCAHGPLRENCASTIGPPFPAAVVQTTAQNLRRRFGCGCWLTYS